MSSVKTKDIDFNCRYANTELFGKFDNYDEVIGNLKMLYAYINKKEGGKVDNDYGKAYRRILRLARAYAGSRRYIISKRQVSNLIKVYEKDGLLYVKIPYAADYIFRAIFSILEEYKQETDVPDGIVKMYGELRRECFYREQCFSYRRWYERNHEKINECLNCDLNTDNGALGGRV